MGNFYRLENIKEQNELIELLKTDFKDWTSCSEFGIINESGDIVKYPTKLSERMPRTQRIARNLIKGSMYELKEFKKQNSDNVSFATIVEGIVIGDHGGDPVNIASGEMSGSLVTTGAGGKGKPKKVYRKKKKEKEKEK